MITTNDMQPVLVISEGIELPLSSKGKAYMLSFKTPFGKKVVPVALSQSRIDAGILSVKNWILNQKWEGLGLVLATGLESLDGTLIPMQLEQPAPIEKTIENPIGECPIKKGRFTVETIGEEGHLTFRLKTGKNGKTTIGVMTGSNNLSDYVWIGTATNEGINFWRKGYQGYPSIAVDMPIEKELATECFKVIIGDPDDAAKRYARESKNCARCNRVLTTPESLDNGLGPECVKFGFA